MWERLAFKKACKYLQGSIKINIQQPPKAKSKELMQELAASYFFDLSTYRHIALFNTQDYAWKALENLEPYLKTLELGKIEVSIPAGAFLIDSHLISIGKGTVIEPGAYIKGPCFIGNNCTVRHGAYIRGNVLTGDKCIIGHDTEIKHTILLDGVHAAHFAYLGDSILGNRVNLGAGTKCANLKLDNKPITVHGPRQRLDTGLRKFGAIIGDDTQTGCNSVTNPGTLLGKSVWCYPCLNVGGFIPTDSVVQGSANVVIKPKAQTK